MTDCQKKNMIYRGDICPCYPIFQSATSAAPTDGLMRGIHVPSYFLQSAHSDILTGGNYGRKILRRLQNCLDTHTDISIRRVKTALVIRLGAPDWHTL